MAAKTVQPANRLRGTLSVPGDKSISHRAIILGALSETPTTIENFLVAEDCLCTLEAFRQMGIAIDREGSRVKIRGRGLEGLKAPSQPLWCGNSGTTTRLLMGVLTGQPFTVRLEGDASLSRRPMDRVAKPLEKMGATFIADVPQAPGSPLHLPLAIRGERTVHSLAWKSPVASAQVKSAILLAGLYASGTTSVEEPTLSRDHTERMLSASGVPVDRQGNRVSITGTAQLRANHFHVPSDLSSAAFFLVAGLLKPSLGVTIKHVGVNPTRTGLLDILERMGAKVTRSGEKIIGGEPLADLTVQAGPLHGTEIGGALIPRAIDEFPILAVLATQAQGRTEISDAAELRVKESDRIAKVASELTKMGAHIKEKADGLIIEGPTPLRGTQVQSYGDHRLAMSLAIAALVSEGPTTIEDTDCVNTSFPEFWSLLSSLLA